MDRLCYIYIFNYRNLINVGFSFDPRYEISVIPEQKLVEIRRNKDFPEKFWGDHIYSLTAIIGKNGTGKSTALRFALEALVEGSGGRRALQGIVVTVDDGERLSIYTPENLQREYRIAGEDIQIDGVEKMEDLPSMESFYYGAHFNPLASPEDILTQRWSGLVNVSDGYLLTRDLQDYGNELATNGFYPLRDYATAYNSQNQYRICYFLNQYESAIKKELRLPRYVLVFPNKAGEWAINNRIRFDKKIELPSCEIPQDWEELDKVLAEIIYHDMVNLMADRMGTPEQWLPLITEWVKTSVKDYSGSIIDDYGRFVQGIKDVQCQELCGYILECVNMLGNFCHVKGNGFRSWLYFDTETDKDLLAVLLNWIVIHKVYLTSRFFDMYYTHSFESFSTLSSGEQALLNLYSRIYDVIIRQKQRGFSEKVPQLYIFDEAEIGLHPEWQRRFVYNIGAFIGNICEWTNTKCQIVITSHSPIVLSDIPVQCCNVLELGENKETKNVTETRKQTFGTNVFELYRDGFFLDGGMVGEYASAFIQRLDKAIENATPDERDGLKRDVMLVGDRVVRDYLMGKLYTEDKEGLKDYYKKMLEDLEDEQN